MQFHFTKGDILFRGSLGAGAVCGGPSNCCSAVGRRSAKVPFFVVAVTACGARLVVLLVAQRVAEICKKLSGQRHDVGLDE